MIAEGRGPAFRDKETGPHSRVTGEVKLESKVPWSNGYDI